MSAEFSKAKSRSRLGRGLDALLPPTPTAGQQGGLLTLAIESLHPRKDQPRKHFDDEKLAELAASINTHGVLEPLLVRATQPGRFEIIAGERRWRAAQRAGLKEVPAIVKTLDDNAAFEVALIENLQRADLNVVEFAQALDRLTQASDLSLEALASRLGKSRAALSNALRLLKLPEPVLALLATERLSEGHGRALLTLEQASKAPNLAERAARERWSVRKLEEEARRLNRAATAPADAPSANPNLRHLETRLEQHLGVVVKVHPTSAQRGRVTLVYEDLDKLDELIAKLTS